MPAFTNTRLSSSIAERPDLFSAALAHILHKDTDKSVVVGQAWLVSTGQLVTCGHVVEPFLKDAKSLIVKFPGSGNEYAIDTIRLHPSFVRQGDLVKYDAALLSLRLREPELSATPLPLRFDVTLKPQQPLWTLRYPAHLSTISASPDPMTQAGHFCGHLLKHDNFHLCHDIALAPGDSGAPLFIEDGVIAIHCGDTGSLPGLNLPTTAIRLALWADALRELGVIGIPSGRDQVEPENRLPMQSFVFLLASFITLLSVMVGAVSYRILTNQSASTVHIRNLSPGAKLTPRQLPQAQPAASQTGQKSAPAGAPASTAVPAPARVPSAQPPPQAQTPPAGASAVAKPKPAVVKIHKPAPAPAPHSNPDPVAAPGALPVPKQTRAPAA